MATKATAATTETGIKQANASGLSNRIYDALNGYFKLESRSTTIKKEFIAALTTFATMSYVLAVHPQIMADAGMDRAQVLTITALVAGVFSILMGLLANLPMAQAPGMGSNALVAYGIILTMGLPWQAAIGLVFWSGVFFLILTLTGIRKMLLDAFPDTLKSALTAGIGLFIMFIGLKGAGILVAAPSPLLIKLGNVTSPSVLLSMIGIPLVMVLMSKKIPGSILLAIVLLTMAGLFIPNAAGSGALSQVPSAIVSMPAPINSMWMALDLGYLWSNFGATLPVLLSLVFIDLFSSLAAMNAMCQRAGLVNKDGNMIQSTQALSADALATIGAAMAGTSTTNVFGESAAGIETGGRTGLVAVFVGLMFFLALFFSPLLLIIPAEATAPALVFIGLLMFTEVQHIDYSDLITSGSAILTFLLMTVTTISDGMAIGLTIYVICMLTAGRGRQVHPLAYILSVVFIMFYALTT